jgi:hypothetical protein
MITARQRRWVISLLVIMPFAILGIVSAWFFGVGTPTGRNLPRPFQSALWKSSDGYTTKIRCAMVADLRNRLGLVGKSATEIVALLGPDETNKIYPHEQALISKPTYYVLCEDFPDYIVMELKWRGDHVLKTSVYQT